MNRQVKKLLDPKARGKIAAARAFGVDLTLVARGLARSPRERLEDLERAMTDLELLRTAARKRNG